MLDDQNCYYPLRQGEALGMSRAEAVLISCSHMFFTREESKASIEENTDEYGDSYARDVTVEELEEVLPFILPSMTSKLRYQEMLRQMPGKFEHRLVARIFRDELEQHGEGLGELPGWMFEQAVLYVDGYPAAESVGNKSWVEGDAPGAEGLRIKQAVNVACFAGAKLVYDVEDETITHIVVSADRDRMKALRRQTSR